MTKCDKCGTSEHYPGPTYVGNSYFESSTPISLPRFHADLCWNCSKEFRQALTLILDKFCPRS